MTLEEPKQKPKPESKKTLKFVPEIYNCNSCGVPVQVREYLDHLETIHKIKLNRRICVHGPIYNDVVAWKRTGDNCLDHKLLTIMDDGRFPGFRKINGSDNSTDGSKELILSYPNTMYFAHGEDYEEAKFNFAMHLASKMGFEYVILLGSDEWIVGNIWSLLAELDKRMLNLPEFESQSFQTAVDEHQPQNKWNKFITQSPKVYYGPGLLRTRYSHWLRYSATQIAKEQRDLPLHEHQRVLPGEKTIVIHHDDSIRGKERNDFMTKFQDRNVLRERNLVAGEVFKNYKILILYTIEKSKAESCRQAFLTSHPKFTHMLIHDDKIRINDLAKYEKKIKKAFEESDYNIICGVYQVDDKKNWRISKDPIERNFATPKLKEIYTKAKLERKVVYHRAIYGVGPFIVIKRNLVKHFSNLSDFEQMRKESLIKDIQIFADSRMQVKL